MYKRLLVPLDGSNFSAAIIPYARCLAIGLKATVELIYVNDPARLAPYAPPLQRGEYLESVAASFSAGTRVKCSIEIGDPAEVIINATGEPGTLVAMATHGYSGAARWLLGSVAQKVLRAATSDSLFVRPRAGSGGGEVQLKTVLAPLDYSPLAEKVLPTVSELARLLDLEVQLIHVTKHVYAGPSDAFLPVFGAIPNLKQIWEEDKAAATSYLTEKVEQLRAHGTANLSFKVLEGGVDGAAAEIIDCAEKIPGSLIAMTSHGQSGIGRWLMGSVAERVVQNSRSPVLVIRPQA